MLNLNPTLIYLAVIINKITCDDFDNYLFAGSDKVTILTDIPASTTQEPTKMELKKPGFFSVMKNAIVRFFSGSKTQSVPSPNIELPEGTYTCSMGQCTPIPNDKTDYAQVKRNALKTTTPGENELTRAAGNTVQFVEPPEILRNIDPAGMLKVLEDEYKRKEELKKQKQNG